MFMEKPKTVTIEFTKEHLKHRWDDHRNCPIYHALQDAGVAVDRVGPTFWWDIDGHSHVFSRSLLEISITLSVTNFPRIRRNDAARKKLIGRRVKVAL